ncbi:endonuclease domain-containing protein [Roseiarcus fermentans]
MRAPSSTVAAAKTLRRNLSVPEAMLWSRVRTRSPEFPAFRRQHPVGLYVLDFYCAKAKLAIEIDGRAHEAQDRPERDARRDAWLRAVGIEVLRIPARDVLTNPDKAADGLFRLALSMIEGGRPPPPR